MSKSLPATSSYIPIQTEPPTKRSPHPTLLTVMSLPNRRDQRANSLRIPHIDKGFFLRGTVQSVFLRFLRRGRLRAVVGVLFFRSPAASPTSVFVIFVSSVVMEEDTTTMPSSPITTSVSLPSFPLLFVTTGKNTGSSAIPP